MFSVRPHLQTYGDHRVFNTPIQEAFIIGSTVGMSAVGLKPIVEVQFADYIWPALNQLFTEVSRSCYLTNGKWPKFNPWFNRSLQRRPVPLVQVWKACFVISKESKSLIPARTSRKD